MLTSPRSRKRNLFLFCDFFGIADHFRSWHNAHLRGILTTFVIATAPCVQAQTPAPSKVTTADAQKVFKIISGDKAKTRVYCQMARLGHQMEQANETGDSKKFDALFNRMYWEKNWVPNMPRWSTDFRTSTHNPKSVRRLVQPWTR
jgi:hypothetical protein